MSARRFLSILAIASLAAATTSAARAAVPYAPNCTVDPCVRVCPNGDMALHVVVRNATSDPVPHAAVVVDFAPCPGVILCPPPDSAPYFLSPPAFVTMSADAAGAVDIPIRAGGICNGGPVNIYASGVFLAQRSVVASPDQNGDAAVGPVDQAILAAKIGGPYDPTADLDCGGTLGAEDAGIQNAHLGHSCGVVVPVLPRTWGRIKTIYR